MITSERLKSVVNYDPETGLFTWIVYRGPKANIGDILGTKTKFGYIAVSIDYKKYYAHRLAWFYMTGKWPEDEIDHKDTNKENNKWVNLREANHRQNQANISKRKDNKSGIKGVYYGKHVSMWIANISVNGKVINLGCFESKEAAAKAYENAAKWYHGEFARME